MVEEFTFEVEDAHRRYEMTVTVEDAVTYIHMVTMSDHYEEVVDDLVRVEHDDQFIPESLAMMSRLSAWAEAKPERLRYPWEM